MLWPNKGLEPRIQVLSFSTLSTRPTSSDTKKDNPGALEIAVLEKSVRELTLPNAVKRTV